MNSEEKYGMRPDPSKDQHLLTNPEIAERMVSISGIKPGDRILEIGAGTGILTERLAKTKAKVTAVEMDRGFGKFLKRLGYRNLKITYENVLKVIDKIEFNKIVSNLPYSICEPLLHKLFRRRFSLAVLSIPENFYRIISSGPGEDHYSILTLKTNGFFKILFKFKIPREDFHPRPRTESVVVLVKPLSKEDYRKCPEKFILKEVFLQRKKKLKNSLMEAIINLNRQIYAKKFTKNMAREVIRKAGTGKHLLERRPEEMRLRDFEDLMEKIRPSL